MKTIVTPRIFKGLCRKRVRSEINILKARIRLVKHKCQYEEYAWLTTEWHGQEPLKPEYLRYGRKWGKPWKAKMDRARATLERRMMQEAQMLMEQKSKFTLRGSKCLASDYLSALAPRDKSERFELIAKLYEANTSWVKEEQFRHEIIMDHMDRMSY